MVMDTETALIQRIAFLEEELKQSRAREARYSQIMECNMVGVLFWHKDGRVLEANQQVLDLTGYSRDELVAGEMNWRVMTPPEFMDRELAAHEELTKTGVCAPFEKEFIRKDGCRVPILIGGALLKDSPEQGVCFILDLSDRREVLRKLEARERLFEDFTNNSPAVAFIKDSLGRRVYLNRTYRELFQNGDELIGKTDYDMFSRQLADNLHIEDQKILSGGGAIPSEWNIPTPDGVNRNWLVYKFPVKDETNQTLIGGVAIDITAVKEAQAQLKIANETLELRVSERTSALESAVRELEAQVTATDEARKDARRSERRLRKWLEQSVVPIQVVSPAGWTVLVNPAWEKLWGVPFEFMANKNLLNDEQVEERGIGTYIRRALAGEAVEVPEVPYVPEAGEFQGSARWCRGRIYPVKDDADGTVEEIIIIHEDVTDRIAAEARLRDEDRILRNLFDVQEQERRLIAYDIHDGLVQSLTGAKLMLDSLAPAIHGKSLSGLTDASYLLGIAIDEARRLISGIRPLVIDERGVVHALQYLIAEEDQRTGANIQFFHQVSFERLAPLLEESLYRIAQEAIRNAKRHSGTSTIEVWLRQEADQPLTLRIRDYGCGFDPAKLPSDRFGLEGIRRRAQIFGGTCNIETELGEGTTLTVEIPVGTSQATGT